MNQKHTQCRLECGTVYQIAWIPAKYAEPGKTIRIKGDGREWVVADTFDTADYAEIAGVQHNAGDIWEATSGPLKIGHK